MAIIHNKPPRYKSYVLRCCEVRSQYPDRPATWRYSLEDSETHKKHAFTSVQALLGFLQTELERPPPDPIPKT